MTPEELENDRFLRAWAVSQVLASPALSGPEGRVDMITAAQRIVAFVKGNGSRQPNGKGKRA